MNTSDNFKDLTGFSDLFIDFIGRQPFFKERFRMNQQLFYSSEILSERAESFEHRDILCKVIKETMNGIDLSENQEKNLKNLCNNKTLATVTGQQVGFLGGPLYTLFKAMSAIRLAEQLENEYETSKANLNFVPVFWIEDNDHDSLEASKISIIDGTNEPRDFFASSSKQSADRKTVSNLTFRDDIADEISKLETALPETPFKEELVQKIKQIYEAGKSWRDAFIELMQYILVDTGILFLSASLLRESGVWRSLVKKELESIGTSTSLVNLANTILDINGYHIQAKTSDINLFYHESGERLKIEDISDEQQKYRIGDNEYHYTELREMAEEYPERFSPNVLLRPVFQDFAIPTIAYISGPSEIGYASQIRELYKFFDVFMPAFISRHSSTILTPRVKRFLRTSKLDQKYFMRPWRVIESELAEEIADADIENAIDQAEKHIDEDMKTIESEIGKIDKNYEQSVRAVKAKIDKLMEQLRKKAISAQKKQKSDEFAKYRQANSLIYPSGTLQERYISPVYFINQMGLAEFKEKLTEQTFLENNRHWYL
jgi:bacillithiol biosynthesis cysteine-adding enzyme BshC